MNVIDLLGRDSPLFHSDVNDAEVILSETIAGSRFLIIGGAGSIGQAVTREVFMRNPLSLHVVDISENNMVELVRDIRSTLGYNTADFRTFAIDCGGLEFDAMTAEHGPYDFVFNLSALKHVRSEKDPYTLMRLLEVNIFNTVRTLRSLGARGAKKYFCVSTDKAANPVNMMGASKRIMELFILRESVNHPVSTARFANVAFSDGSLLHGFGQRIMKRQPLAAPRDVRRYFLTPRESGELCLLSGLLGANREVFFPKLRANAHLLSFSEIACRYLRALGYEPYECDSEVEARESAESLISRRKWPCYFFTSDTTGEKEVEEFFTLNEDVDFERFTNIGVIRNAPYFDSQQLDAFSAGIAALRSRGHWSKGDILKLFFLVLPDFDHKETGRYLDQRM